MMIGMKSECRMRMLPVRSIWDVENDNQSECHEYVESRENGGRDFGLIVQQISSDELVGTDIGGIGDNGSWLSCFFFLLNHWFHWLHGIGNFLRRNDNRFLCWTVPIWFRCICVNIAGYVRNIITIWHLTSQQCRNNGNEIELCCYRRMHNAYVLFCLVLSCPVVWLICLCINIFRLLTHNTFSATRKPINFVSHYRRRNSCYFDYEIKLLIIFGAFK